MIPTIGLLFPWQAGPFGGANQFLKSLAKELADHGAYTPSLDDADVVIFNSHHLPDEVMHARAKLPRAIFLHRIDGPMRLYNHPGDTRDKVVAALNDFAADGTVFQSKWSLAMNRELGWRNRRPERVIGNAPDPDLFFPASDRAPLSGRRVRLIATAWSDNSSKGHDIYRQLDALLPFDRVEMVFVGNTPCSFTNIRQLPPKPSVELASLLRESDIFLTASKNDPCSNSLIEALHCGLPAIALASGGHPEIIGEAGELFEDVSQIPALIDKIVADYAGYALRISAPRIDAIAEQYMSFAGELLALRRNGALPIWRPGAIARWWRSRCLARLPS